MGIRAVADKVMRRSFSAECIVALTAILVRVVYLLEMRASPVFRYTFGDGQAYEAWARGIVSGEWLGKEVFYQAPLYPYFLAVIHALFGPSLMPVRGVQVVLGTISCVLLVSAGRSFFSPGIGFAAGLLLALYPSAVFFDGLIQKSALDLFFMTLLLAVLGMIHRQDRPLRWFGAGLVLGAFLLTRENALALLGLALLWIGVRERATPRMGLVKAFALVAGCGFLVLPVGIRNRVVGGEFHLTTSQFGPNFYIGNNPTANGIYRPLRPGGGDARWERADSTDLAEQALGRRLSPGEVSSYWTSQALDFISKNPGRWLILMGKKWLMFWNRLEIADADDQESFGRWSTTLSVQNTIFHFGVLFPLAAAGVSLTKSRWRDLWVLYAMVAIYAGSVVLFYVFSRYRYPVVPILILFAAAALVHGYDALIHRAWPALTWAAGWALLATLLSTLPIARNGAVMQRAVLDNNIGVAIWNSTKNAEDAAVYYRESIRLAPAYAEPYKNMGTVLRMRSRWEEAAGWYRRALAIQPADPKTLEGLGICATNLGLTDEAIDWFRRALRNNPRLADAHYGLAINLEKLRLLEEAQRHFAEAARLDPTYGRR